MYAKIIVNVPSSNVDTEFTYFVPLKMESIIKVGSRVKVPFGNSNRTIMGIVLNLINELEDSSINYKEIEEVVDFEPIITKKQLLLAKLIKEDTLCPIIRILNLMIPESLQLRTTKYFQIKDYNELDANLAKVFGGKNIIKYTHNFDEFLPKIKKAIDNGIIQVTYDAIQTTKEKKIVKYTLNKINLNNNLQKIKPQIRNSLLMIENAQPLTKNEIIDQIGISEYTFNKCINLNIFNKTELRISRVKEHDLSINNRFIKNNVQYDEVVTKINENLDKPLLWISQNVLETEGVVERVVRNNIMSSHTTLILCPDILSSLKIASILRIKTQMPVACINSNLTKGEYLDLFTDIRNDEYRIIVSTPKGAFIEYPNLKSIIMLDSENDCYYNDQSPRYDLKIVAQFISQIYHTNLCFHTYFPSLEEYVKVIKGLYSVVEHQHFEEDDLNVQVIDLKQELLHANSTKISHKLLQKIKITKLHNKQSLLISNRKYYSNFVMCRSCGEIIKCPKCDIAMQYSQKNDNLLCPACGFRTNMIETCANCGSKTLKMEGTGIEQIVENLREMLPDFKIATIIASNYDEVYHQMSKIEDDEVDIIVSTDLFSRSVIDNNIGLVAIIDLDEVIGTASFLSSERAYSMLLHARQKIVNSDDSVMIIQTYHPDNFVIKSFISGNDKEYLKEEIRNRKLQKNTPFYIVNRILVKGKYEDIFKEAWHIKKLLQDILKNKIYIIGPTYNKIHQAVQLIIKHQNNDIFSYYQKIYDMYQSSSVMIIFDKYPRYL